mmetsp:Transcript_24375/g.66488  ORF Transcript_24375/g.66488 Transcript_24375/m.66488 type:complete len:317 (-) Transcript_24375:210-1160(-)
MEWDMSIGPSRFTDSKCWKRVPILCAIFGGMWLTKSSRHSSMDKSAEGAVSASSVSPSSRLNSLGLLVSPLLSSAASLEGSSNAYVAHVGIVSAGSKNSYWLITEPKSEHLSESLLLSSSESTWTATPPGSACDRCASTCDDVCANACVGTCRGAISSADESTSRLASWPSSESPSSPASPSPEAWPLAVVCPVSFLTFVQRWYEAVRSSSSAFTRLTTSGIVLTTGIFNLWRMSAPSLFSMRWRSFTSSSDVAADVEGPTKPLAGKSATLLLGLLSKVDCVARSASSAASASLPAHPAATSAPCSMETSSISSAV